MMVAKLELQTEEQAAKAAALKKELEIELEDPLLEDDEREKMQAKVRRLDQALDEYRVRNAKPKTSPVDEQPLPPPPNEAPPAQAGPAIILQEAAPPTVDPRPDLADDMHLWHVLLKMAAEDDQRAGRVYGVDDNTLCGVLNGIRCGGTRIRPGKNGWVIRPDIDPSGHTAWTTQEEYDYIKARYLQPWVSQIAGLLQELKSTHPLPG
ncbi:MULTISPECIES: hypothetical protein [unclassified Paenibacillus]|uniref:hypothetical protein n=1 Tax=unclassified Paenibacillus TaxID=185978 RepID=UPI00115FD9BE|nr:MULTISPECIES: hypothetical protein [unclassified Paenibacillus]